MSYRNTLLSEICHSHWVTKMWPKWLLEKQLVTEAGPLSRAAVFEQSCWAFLLQSRCHFCVVAWFGSLEMMLYLMCLAWRHSLSCSLREAVMWKRVLCFVNMGQKWTCGGWVQAPSTTANKDNCILKKKTKTAKPKKTIQGPLWDECNHISCKTSPLYYPYLKRAPKALFHVRDKPTWMRTLVVCGLSGAGNQIAAWHWTLWLPQGAFKQEKRKQKSAAIVWGPLSPENQSIFKYSFQSLALHFICVLQK